MTAVPVPIHRRVNAALLAMRSLSHSSVLPERLWSGGSPSDRLAALAGLSWHVEEERLVAIQHVMDAGGTWALIGDALGVSRQTAHLRYARALAERRLV